MTTEAVPLAVTRLLAARYPTLQINPTWLSECVAYLRSQPGPSRPMTDDQLAKQVRQQLLAADLAGAAASGALAADLSRTKDEVLGAGPKSAILVQVVSIMDIGVSAATQLEVAEARKAARSTLGGAALLHPSTSTANATTPASDLGQGRTPASAQADEDDHMAEFNAQEENADAQATVFPRKTLKLELSDGHSLPLFAFEHQRVPALDMNETKLGCKLLLRNAQVRRGQVLLTPRCVTLEGGEVVEWESEAENRLINLLREKLGKGPLEPRQGSATRAAAVERPASEHTTRRPAPRSNSAAPRNVTAASKKEEADEFDDDDAAFLLAAAELEGGARADAKRAPARPQSSSLVQASHAARPAPKTEPKVETIVLIDSDDEGPGQGGPPPKSSAFQNSWDDAIVID